MYSPLWVNYPQFFSNWLLSRHWVCCSEIGVCNSTCLIFGSLPKRIPTAMGFERTHGKSFGLAVQRLSHWATLSLFIDKSQKLLSILHFSFSLHYQICPTSSNQSVLTFVCCFFALFLDQMFFRHWICCLKWGACISTCVSLSPCRKCIPARWISNSRTKIVSEQQSHA